MNKKIIILGMGFVGQANALALVKYGWEVFAKDIRQVQNLYDDPDFNKIKWLNFDETYKKMDCDVMVCVNALNHNNGGQDYLAAEGACLTARQLTSGKVILRTTVVPAYLEGLDFDFYMPEFLHEKLAVSECMKPEMLVVAGKKEMHDGLPDVVKFLKNENPKCRMMICKPEGAAFVKYLINCWNALRIAFVNEFGDKMLTRSKLSRKDAESVIDFVFGRQQYLRYGKMFGGHCLPKDSEAFNCYYGSHVINGAIIANENHRLNSLDAEELFYGDGK